MQADHSQLLNSGNSVIIATGVNINAICTQFTILLLYYTLINYLPKFKPLVYWSYTVLRKFVIDVANLYNSLIIIIIIVTIYINTIANYCKKF